MDFARGSTRRGLLLGSVALGSALGGALSRHAARADAAATSSSTVPWDKVLAAAQAFLAKETPAGTWPFSVPETASLLRASRKVFFHYFTPFPLSLDNKPAGADYYATQYLQPGGEAGKFLSVGGYLRERPLPAGPWNVPYWREINLAIEVLRARALGADGFGVDLLQLNSGQYWDATLRLLNVAAAVAPGFHVLLEPDATALASVKADDLAAALATLARSPAAFRLADGRLLLAPFAPEHLTPAYWQQVLDGLARRGVKAALLPDLLDLPTYASRFNAMSYGMSEWGARDVPDVEGDKGAAIWSRLRGVGAVWMQPVAPQDERPKSSIYWEAGNTELFRTMWCQAIGQCAAYVHVITWNDYSEGTEVSPSSGTQFLFYDLAAYYIAWYKTGSSPRITRDAILYSHRRQMRSAGPAPSTGTPLRLLGTQPRTDEVEMLAFLTRAATIEIELNGKRQQASAPAGLAVLKAPAAPGRPVFRIRRNNAVVLETTSAWTIAERTGPEDVLYVGGSSTRPFVAAS